MSEFDELFEDYDYGYGEDEANQKECKFCGLGGLHWEQDFDGDGGHFHLYNARNERHVCDPKRVAKMNEPYFGNLDDAL
jgi:hypothetical protein